jgi:signal transduction histidine kinase
LDEVVEAVQLEASRDCPRVPVSVAGVVDELADEFRESARHRGIIFRAIAIGGTAISHPVLLSGMLRNLVRDAIDYTPPCGRVLIVTRRRGSELPIQVRDSGSGIREAAVKDLRGLPARQ